METPTLNVEFGVADAATLSQIARFYGSVGYGGGVSAADTTLFARVGDNLVGVVRLCEEEGVLVLRGMQVAEEYQHMGIGRRLLANCLPYLSKRDAYCLPYVHLDRFYQQGGFEAAAPAALPAFLARRLETYVTSGQNVMAMKRPSGTRDGLFAAESLS